MRLNKKLLKQIQTLILKKPDKFDMNTWANETKGRTPCGTVCCIGGWALTLTGYKATMGTRKEHDNTWEEVHFAKGRKILRGSDVHAGAQRALGLSIELSNKLFYPEGWPEDLTTAWNMAAESEKPFLAAARIERLIQVGE